MLEEYDTDRMVWEMRVNEVNLRSDVLVNRRAYELVKDRCNGGDVLDLGSGNGTFARQLTRAGARVTGVDVCNSQVDFARSLGPETMHPIVYLKGDLMHLEELLPNNTYDIVFSLMTHLYVSPQDLARSFVQVAGRLRSGGTFVYGNVHPQRMSVGEGTEPRKATVPTVSGQTFTTTYWQHPLDVTLQGMLAAGLQVEQIYEPLPTPEELAAYPSLFNSDDPTVPAYILMVCTK